MTASIKRWLANERAHRRRIGFVGLGAMGRPMAANLVRARLQGAGLRCERGWPRRARGGGGEPVARPLRPQTAPTRSLLMVVNADQARAVLFDAGALEALPAAASWC